MIVADATCETTSAVLEALVLEPDAVILSTGLPGDVPATIRTIRRERPAVAVIVLADDDEDEHLLGLVRAGAHGVLLGATNPERLPDIVHGVLAGEAAFPRRLTRLMAAELERPERRRDGAGGPRIRLTEREREVLEALAADPSSARIAARLGIAEGTVRRHVATCARKFGVTTRADVLRIFTAGRTDGAAHGERP